MNIYKTMDQFQNFIWRSSPAIEHHFSWTCLVNGIQPWMHLSICNNFSEYYSGREKFYYIVSKWMCQRTVRNLKSIYGFSTLSRPPPIRRCWLHSDKDPGIEMRIVLSQSSKDFYVQMKYHCIHPKAGTKIFNTL
jgi:hypothetical protein